jgi:fermentation-respiration switch protein FrsA (DUF1100 family)
MKRTTKLMIWTVFLVAIALAAILTLFFVFQRSLMYMPTTDLSLLAEEVPAAEAVEVETADGLRLGGTFVPAAGQRTADAPKAPTMLLFNGNAANRATRAPLARRMSDAGLNALLFDYRGYGGNPGSPTEDGLARDARAALEYLRGREDVDPQRIVVFGESLGSGVAVELAVAERPAALVLRSPFTSMVDAARFHYPWLPVGLLLRDRYPSLERIDRLACPLLVIAGAADGIVPPGQSEQLYEAAPQPKRLLIVPGADHNDLEFSKGALWIEDLVGFLAEAGLLP